MKGKLVVWVVAATLACGVFAGTAASAQQAGLTNVQRGQISDMMHDAYNEVKKHYYDPTLHGLDWDARYKQYSARMNSAQNLGQGFRDVAAFLAGLKDSHTYFIPPMRANRYEAGFRYALVGDNCFVTEVRPGTDAASKLHPGDQILKMNGFSIDRQDFQDAAYYFDILAPQAAMELDLRAPGGQEGMALIKATVIQGKHTLDLTDNGDDYWALLRREENEDHATREEAEEIGDVMIWKFPDFYADLNEMERFVEKASKHKTLILDLRNNGGGSIDELKAMVGSLFDHEVKIADRVGRKEHKPVIAKPYGKVFGGKLIVLVNAESGSAAELLARVVQLEHRGTVIGDRTAGAVMEAKSYSEAEGPDTQIFYSFSVTDADLLMSDGKSLEKTGVTPDEVILPTAADLAAGRDPVLAHAAELAGITLDPAAAGKMFPFEWLPM